MDQAKTRLIHLTTPPSGAQSLPCLKVHITGVKVSKINLMKKRKRERKRKRKRREG